MSALPKQLNPLGGDLNRVRDTKDLDRDLHYAAGNTLAIVALDRLRALRDTGEDATAAALIEMAAQRLVTLVGPIGRVYRVGFDEFATLITAGGLDSARVIDLLTRPYFFNGRPIETGVSIGTDMVGADPADAQRHARIALSAAQSEGRNRQAAFVPEMEQKLKVRDALESDLKRALALQQLHVVYQPQLELMSGRIVGLEALLRWTHPDRGSISPVQFIPLAEETGMVVPIGRWVLKTACREAAQWPDNAVVSVNVSAVQFSQPGLVDTVKEVLLETRLPARRLEIEITESVLIGDETSVLTTLRELRRIGIRIALDDFGTGYSSLGYLRAFPFDKIKIDQSFVRDETEDGVGHAIVNAVSLLGRSLKIGTTAEGVETQRQLNAIADYGCTAVQGYLISKPLPASEVPGFLIRAARYPILSSVA
jgi:predicted signal transduction protein with EAL and GGDEF domain